MARLYFTNRYIKNNLPNIIDYMGNDYYENYRPICPNYVFSAQIKAYNDSKQNHSGCIIAKKSRKFVLLIHGKDDCISDHRLSIYANKFIPNSELILLGDVGHGCIFEKSTEIANLIGDNSDRYNGKISKDYLPIRDLSNLSTLCPKHKLISNNICSYSTNYFKKCII